MIFSLCAASMDDDDDDVVDGVDEELAPSKEPARI